MKNYVVKTFYILKNNVTQYIFYILKNNVTQGIERLNILNKQHNKPQKIFQPVKINVLEISSIPQKEMWEKMGYFMQVETTKLT